MSRRLAQLLLVVLCAVLVYMAGFVLGAVTAVRRLIVVRAGTPNGDNDAQET